MAADSPGSIGSSMARSLDQLSRNIKAAVCDVGKEATTVARAEHKKTAAAATGGDGRFSGLGAAGRLGVRAKQEGDRLSIVPKGTWKIAEEGADPHVIKPKNKSKTLKIGGQVRAGEVRHPGTRRSQGRKAWTRAEEATVRELDRTIPASFDKAVERGFRG
jgi:hypothetical protein